MRASIAILLCTLAAPALADKKTEHVLERYIPVVAVPVALVDEETRIDQESPLSRTFYLSREPIVPVVAFSADGTAAWVAANLFESATCPEGCPDYIAQAKRDAVTKPPYHITSLLDGDRVILLHLGRTGDGVGHASDSSETDTIADDAKAAAALFAKTIGDPKALAASVSDRADVVLYGTEPGERFVGGATVRATLAKWNLPFTKAAGLRAGVTSSKTVAWVAAEVDATIKGKAVPYRVTAIYEKTKAGWRLVQLQFT